MHPLGCSWHWSVSGISIAMIMLALILFGKSFGLSSTYRTLCTISGAGKTSPFFRFDWKAQLWNLYFASGIIAGGFLAKHFLSAGQTIVINPETQSFLFELGLIDQTGVNRQYPLLPPILFNPELTELPRAIFLITIGGLLSGFGSRYAGGCTSGHFISGLSNLQIPSLITLIFFMLGGILSTNFLLPFLLACL
ncbi:MAG: YeeE/YedE family protein [Thermoanaerobaculia bacterium]|nr:YeeE/YedE family protein [Thermoanaerobaculia bacterium]